MLEAGAPPRCPRAPAGLVVLAGVLLLGWAGACRDRPAPVHRLRKASEAHAPDREGRRLPPSRSRPALKEKEMKPEELFEELKKTEGEGYRRLREAIGSPEELKALASTRRRSPDWRTRVQAEILWGWSEHETLYKKILAELDAVNVEEERQTATGLHGVLDRFASRARHEYQEDVLPLCWEAITKFHREWPYWKLMAFLQMMREVPSRASIEPLLFHLQSCEHRGPRQFAGQALARQPRKEVKLRVQAALDASEWELQQLRAAPASAARDQELDRLEEIRRVLRRTMIHLKLR